MNVLDSLVLELGIDSTKFTRGQQEALSSLRKMEQEAQRSGEQIESKARRSEDALLTLKREFLGFFGLAFGGAEARRFVDFVTTLDAQTGRFSRTMGVNTRELSEWQGAFQQVGGTAESANGAIGGLNSEMVKFQLTGQSAMLPVLSRLGISLFDANHHLRSATDLMLQLADAVQGIDARTATGFLSMIPGMNQDAINLLLQGRAAVESYLAAAREAGTTTVESARIAQEYNTQMALLSRTATDAGRSLFTVFAPGMIEATKETTSFLSVSRNLVNQLKSGEWHDAMQSAWELAKATASASQWFANPFSGLYKGAQFLGIIPAAGGAALTSSEMSAARAALAAGMRSGGSRASSSQVETYIRSAAVARGIDPDVAVAVARSEGLGGKYTGDSGSSFGPFQLHYGGLAPGGMSVSGLGDEFTRKTGLSAKNPTTWRAQVDFSLDKAKAAGWGAWHGWHGAAFAGIGDAGGRPPGGGVTINGGVNVYTDKHTADGISSDVDAALRRSLTAGAANYGAQ